MIKFIIIFSLLIQFFTAFASAEGFRFTGETGRDFGWKLDDAEIFSGETKDGVSLIGFSYGPKDGEPILLFNGYGTHFTYMQSLAEKMASPSGGGHRVFIVNPRGQGRENLYSGKADLSQKEKGDYSIEKSAVYDVPAMVDFVYSVTKKPIFLGGHSRGGMIARLGSMGLAYNQFGSLQMNFKKHEMLQKKVSGIFLLFSPPLGIPEREEYSDLIAVSERSASHLAKSFPYLLNPAMKAAQKINSLDLKGPKAIATSLLRFQIRYFVGPLVRGIVGNISDRDLETLILDFFTDQIDSDASEDLVSYLEKRQLVSLDQKVNLGNLFAEKNNFPVFSVGGDKDPIIHPKLLRVEQEANHSALFKVLALEKSGHMLGLLDDKLLDEVAQEFLKWKRLVSASCFKSLVR